MAEQNQPVSDTKIKQEFNKLSIVFKDQLKTAKESKETLREQSASLEGLQKEFSGFTDNIKAVKTTMIKNLEVSKLGNKKLLESNKKLIKNIEKIKNPSSSKNDKTSMFFEKQEEENRAKASYQENHITLLEDILKALQIAPKKKKKEEGDWWDDLLDLGWIGGIGVALLGLGSFFLGLLSGLKELIFKNFPSVEKAWKKVKKSFGTFGEKLSRFGDTIKNWSNKIKNNKFIKFFSGKGGALSRLTGLLSGFSGALKFLKIMFRFGRLLGTANPYILAAIAIWDGLMGGFEELATLDENATFGEKTMAFIKGAFKGVIAGFVGGLLDLGNMIAAWVVGFFSPELAEKMNKIDFTKMIKEMAGNHFDGLMRYWSGAMDFWTGVFTLDWEKFTSGFSDLFSGWLTMLSLGMIKDFDHLKQIINDFFEPIAKWWDSWSFEGLFNKYIWDPLKEQGRQIANIDFFSGIYDAVAGLFTWDGERTGRGVRKVVDSVGRAIDAVVSAFRDLLDTIGKGIDSVAAWWNSWSFKGLFIKYIYDPIANMGKRLKKWWNSWSFKGVLDKYLLKPAKDLGKKLKKWWDKDFSLKSLTKMIPFVEMFKKLAKNIKQWFAGKIDFKTLLYETFIKPIVNMFLKIKKWVSDFNIIESIKKYGSDFMKGFSEQRSSHGGGLLRGGTTKVLAGEAIERLKTGELYVHNESKTKGIMDKSEKMAARRLQPQAPTVVASNPTNNMVNNSNSNNITTNNTSIAKFGPDAALMDVFVGAAANA